MSIHQRAAASGLDKGTLDTTLLPVLTVCDVEDRRITSPNCSYIPLPPWHSHDYYHPQHAYLAALPKKPSSPSDPLSLLWYDIIESDISTHPDTTVLGFGSLNRNVHEKFNNLRKQLIERVDVYRSQHHELPTDITAAVKRLNHTCIRAGEVSSTIEETRFAVVEFQRCYLELHAMLDWHEFYLQKFFQLPSTNTDALPPHQPMGAFTTDPGIAARLYSAGLPVFLIHRHRNDIDIGKASVVTCQTSASLTTHDSMPPHPTIYQTAGGEEDINEKIEQIRRYSRVWMFYNPESSVRTEGLDLIPNASYLITLESLMASRHAIARLSPHAGTASASTGSARTSNEPPSHRSKSKRKATSALPPSEGRNPFTVLDSEYFPKPSSMWTSALEGVNQSRGRLLLSYQTNPSFNRFALPDPHLLVTPSNDEKKISYLFAWLKSRPSLMFQARKQLTLAQRTQTWREYLELLGRNTGTKSESVAGKVRAKIQDTYTFLLSHSDLCLADPTAPPAVEVRWRGIQVLRNQPLVYYKPVFRDITWELNECNFRLEFFALDCLMSQLDIRPSDRIHKIAQCFEHTEFLPPTRPAKNSGLAADDWEQRLPYVLAFVKILKQWKGVPEVIRKHRADELPVHLSAESFAELEREAAHFYCQAFFCYFGRAPSIPRQLHIN